MPILKQVSAACLMSIPDADALAPMPQAQTPL